MGLLDQEIEQIKSSNKKWALCKYCTMPFLASYKQKSCNRCTHFVQYEKERKHRLMLFFFITNTIIGIGQSYIASFIIRYTKNTSILVFFLVLFVFVSGSIIWKIFKKIDI